MRYQSNNTDLGFARFSFVERDKDGWPVRREEVKQEEEKQSVQIQEDTQAAYFAQIDKMIKNIKKY